MSFDKEVNGVKEVKGVKELIKELRHRKRS